MKKYFPIIFGIILFAVIGGIVIALSNTLLNEIFKEADYELKSTALNVFAGALFAFIFLRISELLTAYYEKQKNNYNAIVRLEHICLSMETVIHINSKKAKTLLDAINLTLKNDELSIFPTRFIHVSVDKNTFLDLTNIDVITKVTDFNRNLDFMNASCAGLNSSLQHIYDTFTARIMDGENKYIEQYKRNLGYFREECIKLNKFLDDLLSEEISLRGTLRALKKSKPIFVGLTSFFTNSKLTEKDQDSIKAEFRMMQEENSRKLNDDDTS